MRFEYRTPGTNLWWSTVAEWVSAARQLDRRRSSSARNRALAAHGGALPRDVIAAETSIEAIETALHLLKYGPPALARPPRGDRGDHPTTRVIMDLMNHAAILRRKADEIPEGANWRAVHGPATCRDQ